MKKIIIRIILIILGFFIWRALCFRNFTYDKLTTAISNGRFGELKQANFYGDLSKIKDSDKTTLLMYVAAKNNIELTQWLIKKAKVEIDATNKDGETALMYAAHYNSMDTLKILVENNANINLKAKDGKDALFCAIAKNATNAADYLVKQGLNIETLDNEKNSLLMCAIWNNAYDSVRWLIKKGVNINTGLAPEFPKFFPKYRYTALISKGRAIIFDF